MKIKQIKISPSTMQLFMSCPQKFMYEVFRDRTEKEIDVQNPSAAEWGTLMHTRLAAFYSGAELVPSGNKFVDKRFDEYLANYKDEIIKPDQVEVRLERPLTEKIILCGTADMVVGTTIWDHKTQSSISDKDHAKYDLSDQFTQYGWLAGFDAFDVVINQISYAANPGAREANPEKARRMRFDRIYTSRSEAQVADWLKRTAHNAKRMVDHIENQTAYLERRTSACGEWSGCFFATQCSMGIYTPDNFSSLTNTHFSCTFE